MRINAKKKEHANAPVGPFTMFSLCVYGCNVRSELIYSHRGAENAEDGYAYDDIGNLLVSYIGANTNSYSANNLNQYTSILHASAPSSEDYLFYDLDGNLTNDSVFAYSYDAQNRLVSVSSNDVAHLVNEYDSKSRRVMKVTPEATTTYFYDDWNLIEERIDLTNGDSALSTFLEGMCDCYIPVVVKYAVEKNSISETHTEWIPEL